VPLPFAFYRSKEKAPQSTFLAKMSYIATLFWLFDLLASKLFGIILACQYVKSRVPDDYSSSWNSKIVLMQLGFSVSCGYNCWPFRLNPPRILVGFVLLDH
jgi:hypothetical protein